jgi:AcrR family transcriptional regulator
MPAASAEPLRGLPSGRHSLSPQAVSSDQRRRMLTAMAIALEEHGYAQTTVAQVLKGAGVSRRTFYEQFADKDDCLLAAYEEAEGRVWAVASAAGPDPWPQRVRAALGAVLDLFAAEPATARLFTLEARAALPQIAIRQRQSLDRVAAALRAGNRRAGAAGLPEGAETALVDNVAALAGSYVLSGATELLPTLVAQLADHLLLPLSEAERAGAIPGGN